jgi:hypothetical protein
MRQSSETSEGEEKKRDSEEEDDVYYFFVSDRLDRRRVKDRVLLMLS